VTALIALAVPDRLFALTDSKMKLKMRPVDRPNIYLVDGEWVCVEWGQLIGTLLLKRSVIEEMYCSGEEIPIR